MSRALSRGRAAQALAHALGHAPRRASIATSAGSSRVNRRLPGARGAHATTLATWALGATVALTALGSVARVEHGHAANQRPFPSPPTTTTSSTSTPAIAPADSGFEIPIEVLDGIVLTRATFRTRGGSDTTGWLVLDTGAGYLSLDTDFARFVGIADSTTDYRQLEQAEGYVPRLRLGPLEMDQVGPVLVFDAQVIRNVTDRDVLGLIGERTLTGFAARLDYGEKKLTLLPVAPRSGAAEGGSSAGGDDAMRADAPASGGPGASERVRRSREALTSALSPGAIAVPYQRTDEGKLLVAGWVSDPKPPRRSRPLRLVLDTGASKSVLFAPRVREMAPRAGDWPALRGLTSPTLSGIAEAWVARVPRLEIEGAGGIARASDIDVAILEGELGDALSREVGAPVDGLLGYSFLRRFRTTIDLVNHVVWFEPVPHGYDDREHEYSHVGAQIERRGDVLEVTGVATSSPADRAGVRRGDELVAIDGAPVAGLDLIHVGKKLEGPPGSKVTITFRREGVARTVTLVRRRLL